MTPFPGASNPKPTFQELVTPVVSGQAFKFIRGPGAPRVPRAAARRALLLLLLLLALLLLLLLLLLLPMAAAGRSSSSRSWWTAAAAIAGSATVPHLATARVMCKIVLLIA